MPSTRLNVISHFERGEAVNTDILLLIEKVSGVEFFVEFVVNDDDSPNEFFSPVFYADFDSPSELKGIIKRLFDHKFIPIKGFEHIAPDDFGISLENDNIDDAYQFLADMNFRHLESQVDTLDYVVTDIVSEQEEIKNRVESLYHYMDSAGVLYYKQMVNYLLDKMGEKGIIDAQQLKDQMQKEIH